MYWGARGFYIYTPDFSEAESTPFRESRKADSLGYWKNLKGLRHDALYSNTDEARNPRIMAFYRDFPFCYIRASPAGYRPQSLFKYCCCWSLAAVSVSALVTTMGRLGVTWEALGRELGTSLRAEVTLAALE